MSFKPININIQSLEKAKDLESALNTCFKFKNIFTPNEIKSMEDVYDQLMGLKNKKETEEDTKLRYYLNNCTRKIDKVIVHCSDSSFGDVDIIRQWHLKRGFDNIGYHFVILNGHAKSQLEFISEINGQLQIGRRLNIQGAHCRGHNSKSIGICLIGKRSFSSDQIKTLQKLKDAINNRFGLTIYNWYTHNYFNKNKTCPNMSNEKLREILS